MSQPKVDRQNKVIRDYRVMTLGDTRGHGMTVDAKTLDQLVELGNASPNGTKTRVRHADASGDGFGRYLGQSRNFRRTPDGTIADLYLSELAFKSPEGDLGTYVMDAADLAPDTFGASPEAIHLKERVPGSLPAMRLKELMAIAIVDDPATNVGFFSRLVTTEETDMSVELENKIAELTKERDSLATELSTAKLSLVKVNGDLTAAGEAHKVALSAARADGIAAAVKAERERVQDVLVLCSKAQKVELSAKYIADGTSKGDVQEALFVVLCANNKPLGDDGNGGAGSGKQPDKNDPNAKYKAEYVALSAQYQAAGVSEDDYVKTRRVDDGIDPLMKPAS